MTVMIRLLRPIMDGLIAIATTDKNKMIKITCARPSNLDLQNCSRIIPDVASLSLNVVQFSVCELTVGSGTGRTYRRTNGRMGGWGITLDGHVFLQYYSPEKLERINTCLKTSPRCNLAAVNDEPASHDVDVCVLHNRRPRLDLLSTADRVGWSTGCCFSWETFCYKKVTYRREAARDASCHWILKPRKVIQDHWK